MARRNNPRDLKGSLIKDHRKHSFAIIAELARGILAILHAIRTGLGASTLVETCPHSATAAPIVRLKLLFVQLSAASRLRPCTFDHAREPMLLVDLKISISHRHTANSRSSLRSLHVTKDARELSTPIPIA